MRTVLRTASGMRAGCRKGVTLALLFLLILAAPLAAQPAQPTQVDPNAAAVSEQQLLQHRNQVQGQISIPDKRENMLIHPAGRDWRAFHEVTLPWIGGIVILGMLLLLVAFYLWRGTVRLERGRSGRKLVRFMALERLVHWITAISFIVLALTGLNVTFGKRLLLPLMDPQAFSTWSQWAKYIHNFASFPFMIGVVLIFFMWVAGNLPNRVDVEWLKRGGGIAGRDHPPAYRFNAGQKAIFWFVTVAGVAIAASGLLLMFPFYGTNINTMQDAQIAHGVIAMLFVAVILAHIYIGTIGMEGAFEAMGEGTVDVNWAREHHELWLTEEHAATGPAERHPQPSSAVAAE